MKSRWYISILIIALTFLGSMANDQHVPTANQELVLEFTNENTTNEEALQAIAVVKQQLDKVGVDNIQVVTQGKGRLKLTYYSASDVASVKALLSKEKALELDYISSNEDQSTIPSEDNSLTYNIDVYEIQQGDDASSLAGQLALETKSETDRLINPNVFIPVEISDSQGFDHSVRVTYKWHRELTITIKNKSRIIPEVRAGPASNGMYNVS